ncbi:MAG TPA: 16S rRNA (cytosine(1402)-N(4))-methyltransferase RsmH [Coleofasciculaceae cyanobacterium]
MSLESADPIELPVESPVEPSALEFAHVPVLSHELIEGLALQPYGHYLDATVGGGGHSRLILAAFPEVTVTAIDQDEQAIAAATANLAEFGDRVQFCHTNFAEFHPGDRLFDGIIADLGVSSAQFDRGDRGFSFRHAAPLDMRMNQQQDLTAAEIINTWDEIELARIFYTYGEERLSRKMARRIVEKRPLHTTDQLAELIFYSVPHSYRYGRIHPATRVFQALRIVVNRELEVLETLIQTAPQWLKPEGRMGIISFHSLEDRIVKHRFRESEVLRVLTKKPIVPTEQEIRDNGRSRSAKLRIAARRSESD